MFSMHSNIFSTEYVFMDTRTYFRARLENTGHNKNHLQGYNHDSSKPVSTSCMKGVLSCMHDVLYVINKHVSSLSLECRVV